MWIGRIREADLAPKSFTAARVCGFAWAWSCRPGVCGILTIVNSCVSCSVFETTESVVLELELMSRNDLFDELSTAGVLKEHKTAAIVYQVTHRLTIHCFMDSSSSESMLIGWVVHWMSFRHYELAAGLINSSLLFSPCPLPRWCWR